MRGRAGLGLALLVAAAGAMAQRSEVAEPPALRCLAVKAGAAAMPEFPPDEFRRRERGGVQLLLEFTAPDREPRVTVQEHTGQEAFVEAVRAHAKDLRAPCLQPNEVPLRVIRDYVFRPDDREVHWSRASDADAAAKAAALKCVRHRRGREASSPNYPREARSGGVQGRVLAHLRFAGPDVPPEVQLHAQPSAALLLRPVERWVEDLRMPCHSGGSPLETVWLFEFKFQGEAHWGFHQSFPFNNLLAATKGIRQQALSLDTTRMSCPFEVAFHYRRPWLRNAVGEVGTSDPARRPLLEWMEAIELDLEPVLLDSVYGDSTRITIPCIRINLKPKE